MYLWPTVAETAVCRKDRATATVDLSLFLVPSTRPASCQATLAVPVYSTLQINPHRAFSAHNFFHCGFNYTWFQLNECVFLHWICIYYLLKTTLVISKNMKVNCYLRLQCDLRIQKLLCEIQSSFGWNKELFSHSSRTWLFGTYNEKECSYLNNWASISTSGLK